MSDSGALKRVNVYVNADDLEKVANDFGCRPSEAVRRLIDNYLLAAEIDEVRRMPGEPIKSLFRQGAEYQLPDVPDEVSIDSSDAEPAG